MIVALAFSGWVGYLVHKGSRREAVRERRRRAEEEHEALTQTLRCERCGAHFHIGRDSAISAGAELMGAFRLGGSPLPGSGGQGFTDVVGACDATKAAELRESSLASLQRGLLASSTWMCNACRHKQVYALMSRSHRYS